MRKLIEGYATDYAITDNLLQNTHKEGKVAVFGNSKINVQYLHVLKTKMQERGHPVELIFASYNANILSLSKVVVNEENRCQKNDGLTLLNANTRKAFLSKWMTDNEGLVQLQMGGGYSNTFLIGILFSTNASLTTAPHLQKVVQADLCHMHFGKYTMFSAYGSTANGSMSPITKQGELG